ncbi:low specificity L-threonine aldolase [Aquiluna sp. KACHI24]|uniref:threonine aldolase family protein n=1 Tax=Aquiluna sp. KACHI24 TaxID=2968831 RepID=UPI00220F97B8|nr:low specificity L-threonine aldolase [Aquiluna sp. KACHI24]BDQ00805.1 threonine aldolase [Aquiluna sp. KACHI24]
MKLHDESWRGFASDNYSGVHPEVLQALAEANLGHQTAYGEDQYTARLSEVIKEHFGSQAEVFPVFNGTGANVVGLTSMMPRWGAVICSNLAHIHTDEGGAPERVSGLKLFTVEHQNGKLTPELIATQVFGIGDEHRAQPMVVSITQTTEVGTVYSPQEIRAIADYAHSQGLLLHLDGARLWNAAAALGVPFSDFTTAAGVDVLSLGGTKNGLMGAEAIVVLNPKASDGLIYLRKLSMQLASKMRFVSAQLLTLFENDLGIRSASHANAMAQRLRRGLEAKIDSGEISGLRFTNPTMANAVFASLDNQVADRIRAKVKFYDWERAIGEVRWMCAFDTTEQDVDNFINIISEELNR